MRKKTIWGKLSVLLLALAVVSLLVSFFLNKNSQIIELTNIKTELQNNCLVYDKEDDRMYVGTYNNMLMVFDDQNELLWQATAKGPYCKLILDQKNHILYAGNEDNNVYILDMDTGEMKNTINVQRRIYDIDVTSDGSEIVISAGVSTNKHNILIYNSEGEQLQNIQYKTRIQGVSFTADDSAILLINNRGEIIKTDKQGNELAKIQTKYELVSLSKAEDTDLYAALCSDGSYTVFDDNLQIARQGAIRSSMQVTSCVIGMDTKGESIAIGTKEGYFYLFNKKDEQVFAQRFDNTISGTAAAGNLLYITGFGDFVYQVSVNTLENIKVIIIAKNMTLLLGVISSVFLLVCLLLKNSRCNRKIKSFFRIIRKYRTAYILLLPTFILLFFFNYVPVATAIGGAFTNWSKDFNTWAELKFVGIENFKLMISEGYFLIGVKNLVLMLFCGFLKVLTVPLLVAWLVYSLKSPKAKYGFRFLFVLPMVVPGVVSALMWEQIYDPTIGMLNQLLQAIGLDNLQRVWLGDSKTAIWAIIFMGFPFINALAFLVYYAGFINIDASLYEAAKVDGATRRKIFTHIQFPMIGGELIMMIILTFIGTVQDYTGIYILTGGGPGTSTYVPGLELYYNATKFGRYGYACALGIVMFLVIMAGTLLNMRIKSKNS